MMMLLYIVLFKPAKKIVDEFGWKFYPIHLLAQTFLQPTTTCSTISLIIFMEKLKLKKNHHEKKSFHFQKIKRNVNSNFLK